MRIRALWTGLQQCGFALMMLVPLALTLVALAGSALALFPLFSAVVVASRQLTNAYRGFLGSALGVTVPAPYLPVEPDPEDPNPWSAARMRQFVALAADPATWLDLVWMLLNPVIGVLTALLPAVLLVYGPAVIGFSWLVHPSFGPVFGGWHLFDPTAFLGERAWAGLPVGLLIGLVVVVRAPVALRCQLLFSQALLGPTINQDLVARVEQLTESRADVTSAQEAELRRIERDLHDGAQVRMVAVGMTLRTVERLLDTEADPAAVRELVVEARETSAAALRELRGLVRGIRPPILAERGLPDAVRAVALQSPLAVTVDIDLPEALEPPIEAALYFAICELLTNVAKHAEADHASIRLRSTRETIIVTVGDDGRGGANPEHGSGLRGIDRRLASFDATMTISSPAGGPTTVIMEIPRAHRSRRGPVPAAGGPDPLTGGLRHRRGGGRGDRA